MIATDKAVAKSLIELSATIEEADKAVEDYLGNSPSPSEKLACLKDLFGSDYVQEIGHHDDPDDIAYTLWLNAIIKEKYS